ncbi:MAG: NAD(P)-binding domain-containing protein [Burkholderiales bacterium]
MTGYAIIGWGREAQGVAQRLRAAGLKVAAWNPGAPSDIKTYATLPELFQAIAPPRVVWFAPAVDSALTLALLQPLLNAGDMIVDCAPAHYRAVRERAQMLAEKKHSLVDAGIAGGDEEYGYALTLGGDAQVIEKIKPALEAISPKRWLHCGPSGSGHFVKQIQDLMQGGAAQAWAGGLAALKKTEAISVDLRALAQIWQNGGAQYGNAQALAAEFLHDANVLQRIVANNPGETAKLQREMTPALNLALSVHYAGQGMSLFQSQIAAMLGGIPPRG